MTPAELAEQADEDLRTVMGSVRGRRFVFRLLDSSTGLLGTSFTGDALTSAFQEGRRAVGVGLLQECQRVSSLLYRQMMREAFALSESVQPTPQSPTHD